MKLVTIDDLREGDIIASDVMLEDYTVVLTKGTVIKTPYIEKLREMEIFTVYIEEPQESGKAPAAKAPIPQKPAAKAPAPQKAPQAAPKTPVQPKAPAAAAPKNKLSLEKVTILRDDVEEQVKNKIKDILEMHVYQQTEGLEKIAETAQNIITDILEEDEVVEKVYDVKERSADIYEHSLQVCTIATLISLKLGLTKKQVYDISVACGIWWCGMKIRISTSFRQRSRRSTRNTRSMRIRRSRMRPGFRTMQRRSYSTTMSARTRQDIPSGQTLFPV